MLVNECRAVAAGTFKLCRQMQNPTAPYYPPHTQQHIMWLRSTWPSAKQDEVWANPPVYPTSCMYAQMRSCQWFIQKLWCKNIVAAPVVRPRSSVFSKGLLRSLNSNTIPCLIQRYSSTVSYSKCQNVSKTPWRRASKWSWCCKNCWSKTSAATHTCAHINPRPFSVHFW